MATAALAESFDAPGEDPNAGKVAEGADNDQGGVETGERDFEAEARSHGWVPKEEFKGDPTRWTDAESFVKKADEVMPLLRKKTQAQDREIADLKKQIKRASEHFSKAEERAYERALADIKSKQEKAVADGDVEAFRAADKELDALRKDVAPKDKPEINPVDVKEALIDFRDANPWYDAGGKERDYADLMAEKFADKTESMQPAEFFQFIADKVLERYPAAGKGKQTEEQRRRSPVEGGGTMRRSSNGGKTFENLPVEAQRACDKWHRTGVFGDPSKTTLAEARKRYVETYQWDAKD